MRAFLRLGGTESLRALGLVLFTAILLSGCSKFGRLSESEKEFTDVSFGSASQFSSLNSQNGGVVIWGVAGEQSFALTLTNEGDTSSPRSIRLPNGAWTFSAVGWTGSNALEGTVRCGQTLAVLNGTSQTVNIEISNAPCSNSFFSPTAYLSSGQPKALKLITCASLGGVSSATSNCDSGARGDFLSYRVEVPSYALAGNPVGRVPGARLTSQCVDLSAGGGNSSLATAIKIPAGESGSSPFFTIVKAYSAASCAGTETIFSYRSGLLNSAESGTSAVYSGTGELALFLLHAGAFATISNITSSTVNGSYALGQSISIQVEFSEAVTVTGSPQLALSSGGTATYSAGSGTSSLTFNYTIADGENSPDLDISQTGALTLNGGTITAVSSGSNATLTCPTPGGAGSLYVNKNLVVSGLKVNKVYSTNGNWNDYVKFTSSGAADYAQADTACDGTETGYYGQLNGCIHGGEKRKVLLLGYSSCSNLTISDALGAWNWVCVPSAGSVTFYSQGVKKDKGLRDLVNASGWLNNTVTILDGATPRGTSVSEVWGWTNPVTAPTANANGAMVNLNTAGTIYYINSNTGTAGYSLGADKVSFVTLGASILSFDLASGGGFAGVNCTGGTTYKQILCASARKFLWVEATMSGGVTNIGKSGLTFNTVIYSRVNGSAANGLLNSSNAEPAFDLVGSNYNLFTGVSGNGLGRAGGLRLSSSTYNRFRSLQFSKNLGGGAAPSMMALLSGSNYNRFHNLNLRKLSGTTTGTSSGIEVNGSSNNAFNEVFISNINGSVGTPAPGVHLFTGSTNNIFTKVFVAGGSDSGFFLETGTNSTISHFTAANLIWEAIFFNGGGTVGNFFHSVFLENPAAGVRPQGGFTDTGNVIKNIAVGDTPANHLLDFGYGSGGVFDLQGYIIRPSGQTCTPGAVLLHTLTTSCTYNSVPAITAPLSSAIPAKVTSDSQAADTAGQLAFASITDWHALESPYRNWGLNGSAFPFSDNRGDCISGTCQIWDWRAVTGSAIHNKSGNGSTANGAFTAGSTCPAEVAGSVTETVNGNTFLRHADEIADDEIGDNDGLCESNESCIYAPNIGAYQGEGNYLTAGTCTFSDGTVTGVSMYAYPTTGI
jgi:hypothetical protein